MGLAGLPNGIGTAHAEQRFTTRVGQTATVTLDDGTKVTLDTDSALRVSHNDGQRQVRMERGRAFFDVAQGDKRPFMVLAQGNFVLAVSEGTFGGAPTSYYDLWRVENGKIAEHWDVMETIADQSTWANDNGKF